MTPPIQQRSALGQAARDARLARVRTIRKRVITGAVSVFVAVWLLIAVMLVTGRDPALSKSSSTAAVASSSSTSSSPAASTQGASSPSSSSPSSPSQSSSSPSSVTTRQS